MDTSSPVTVAFFWICAGGTFYAYAGYPLVIAALARVFGRTPAAPDLAERELPRVCLLIAAYNEATVIGPRLENALAMDYPRHRLEIVVASDGSDDGTADVVRRFAPRGVRLLEFPCRQGKASTLNAAMAELAAEVVLLSDANTHTDPAAVRNIVRWFRDGAVGVVCGRLVLTDPATGRNADGVYWKYETFLKRCEGRLDALLGSNGAIYAIRRDLFRPIPPETIVDDLVIPLRAKVRTGCRIVYEPDAVAFEESAPDVRAEFRRRSRIGAGGFQAIGMLWPLLDPRRGWVAFSFLSHKILRWSCPFLLVGSLIASLLLAGRPFYRAAFAAQTAFYVVALVPTGGVSRIGVPRALRASQMFVTMNAALMVGFFRWLGGTQKGIWQPTARPAPLRRAA